MSKVESKSPLSLKDAMDVVINFHVVYKLSKVYEANNRQFQERIQILWSSIQKMLDFEDEVQIRAQEGFIFVGGIRLKFSFATYAIYQFILQEFHEWHIGTIAFLKGLRPEEIQECIGLLAKMNKPKENPFDWLSEDFKVAALAHIRLEKIKTIVHDKARERNAAPMYFLGIHHLKTIFDSRGGLLNLQVTKRWIQTICNLLSLDESVLFGLTSIKNFEEYTLNHSVNVCVLSLALGRRLGLSRPELIELGISACLHDVGKLEIPQAVLDKPGRLDAEERAVIETHSHRGAGRLIQTRSTQEIPIAAILVALEHHITPQFAGYPRFVWRTKTSFFSKIVKVIDYYDAITTKRVYRPKTFTPEEALKLMAERGDEEFDPLILKAFVHMIGVYPVGSLVVLDTAEIGIVVEANLNAAFVKRPKVKLIADAQGNKTDGPVVDLTEMDGTRTKFRKSILMALDTEKYQIRVCDYLLARDPSVAAAF